MGVWVKGMWGMLVRRLMAEMKDRKEYKRDRSERKRNGFLLVHSSFL